MPQDVFPLLPVSAQPPDALTLLKIEMGREAATLLMLAALATALTGRLRHWLPAFVLAFGVWDLAFYAWLRVLIGWPTSLATWDLLFLLPVPWAAPVLAPVIVASTMSIFGAALLLRELQAGRPVSKISPLLFILAVAILLGTFTWDWRRWVAGAMPAPFPWAAFAIGEALVIAGFLVLLRSPAHLTKKAFLSTDGSTATSKNPTIISSQL